MVRATWRSHSASIGNGSYVDSPAESRSGSCDRPRPARGLLLGGVARPVPGRRRSSPCPGSSTARPSRCWHEHADQRLVDRGDGDCQRPGGGVPRRRRGRGSQAPGPARPIGVRAHGDEQGVHPRRDQATYRGGGWRTRTGVRYSTFADAGYHPPFDPLRSSSGFEYGNLVDPGGQHANHPLLVEVSALSLLTGPSLRIGFDAGGPEAIVADLRSTFGL